MSVIAKNKKEQPPKLYDSKGSLIDFSSMSGKKRGVSGLDTDFMDHGLFSGMKSMENRVRRSYATHAWVYACVSSITNNIAALHRILIQSRTQEKRKDMHPLLTLLDKPNPFMDGTEFIESIILNLLLPTIDTPGGQCFILPLNVNSKPKSGGKKPNLHRGDIPDFLFPYSDRFFKPVVDKKTGVFKGWKMSLQSRAGTTEDFFTPEEIIRIRLVNPYDTFKGLSPWSAANISVEQDIRADEYNTMYYDNTGAIGGLLSTDQDLERETAEEYLEWWMENYSGAGNNGKTAILGNGLKYERFARTNVDMQFMEQRADSRKRVQAVYGVPDSEIAIFESGMNRATAKQADENYWKKTLIPLDKKINSGLTKSWIRNIPDLRDYVLQSDYHSVEALREDYKDRIDSAKILVDMNIPPAEACRVMEIPVDTDRYPWLEKSLVNAMLLPADMVAEGNVGDYTDDKESIREIVSLVVKALSITSEKQERALVYKDDGGGEEVKRDPARDEFSFHYIRTVLEPGERSMRSKMERFVHKLKRDVLDNVDKWMEGFQKGIGGVNIRQSIIDPNEFMFDLEAADEEITNIYSEESVKQIERERVKVSDELGGVDWEADDEWVNDNIIDARRGQLRKINRTTFSQFKNKVTDTIRQSVNEGWTIQQTADALKENVKLAGTARANQTVTIARTEVGTVSSLTRESIFKYEQIKDIDWVSSKDELVRKPPQSPFNHAIDGEVVEFASGKRFSNGLRFPRDPSGQAGNVINCRCTYVKAGTV